MSEPRRILSRMKDGRQRRTHLEPDGSSSWLEVTPEQLHVLHNQGYELLDDGVVESLLASHGRVTKARSELGEALRRDGKEPPRPVRFQPGATSVALENQQRNLQVQALVDALMRSGGQG